MNGAVSASMREKGAVYKLNFGVSLPDLKRIAANYTPNDDLAEALWQEDVREMKILAAMLQPADSFSKEEARRWASMLTQPDLIEFVSTFLFRRLPYAGELAAEWVAHSEELMQLQGFHLFARICMDGRLLSRREAEALLREAEKVSADDDARRIRQAAFLALKYYGIPEENLCASNKYVSLFTV
jgi:3-methyladenine DNA glycosylase AlkD